MDIRPIDANALAKMACAYPEFMTMIAAVPVLSLNTLRDAIYEDAVAHGLWDYPQYCRTKSEILDYVRAACVERIREELTEAMEAVRNPDEFAEELTDATITIFSTFGHLGIDIDAAIRRKMEINKGRPWKHGKE